VFRAIWRFAAVRLVCGELPAACRILDQPFTFGATMDGAILIGNGFPLGPLFAFSRETKVDDLAHAASLFFAERI
jgi:hypothetical protein